MLQQTATIACVTRVTWSVTTWQSASRSPLTDLGAEILCFREVIDDDVTLEHDVVDALSRPNELGGSSTDEPRLQHTHTHTHGPQQLSINQSTEIQVTARRRQLVIQPTWAYCLTAVISSLTELFQAVANTVTDSSICWQRPITWLQTVMTNLYNN